MNHSVSLNGIWRFAFDPFDEGIEQQWMLEENQPYLENKMRCFIPGYWKKSIISMKSSEFSKIAWYWRKITIKKLTQDPYYLIINGIHDSFDIFIDGTSIGHFYSGGLPRKINIDDYLTSEKYQYFFAIRVNISDDFNIYLKKTVPSEFGGIINPISIASKPQISLIEKSFSIDFKRNSSSNKINYAELEFVLYFHNSSEKEFNGTVIIDISRDFLQVTKKKHRINILANNTRMIRLILTIDHDNIDIWDLESPNYYNLTINLVEEVNSPTTFPIYSYNTLIGLRELEVTSSGEIILNSRLLQNQVKVYNILSEEFECINSDIDLINWLKSIKSKGFNLVRSSNLVFSKIFYEIATKIGLFIEANLPIINISNPEIIQHISDYIFMINFYPSLIGYNFLKYPDNVENLKEIQSNMKVAAKKLDSNLNFL